jgi:hypothetical protein
MNFPEIARKLVFEHVKKRLEPTDKHITFGLDEVYIVTFSYVLGHHKAFVSTTLPDGMYYEVTRNNLDRETYITAYKQWDHVTIEDKEPY